MMYVAHVVFLLNITGLRREVPGTGSGGWHHLNSLLGCVCSGNIGCLGEAQWSGKQFIQHRVTSELISDCVEGLGCLTGEKKTAPSGFVLNATPKCWWLPCWVHPQGKQWGTDWQPLRKWNWTSQIRHQGRVFIKQASDLVSSPARQKALCCLWLHDNPLSYLIF